MTTEGKAAPVDTLEAMRGMLRHLDAQHVFELAAFALDMWCQFVAIGRDDRTDAADVAIHVAASGELNEGLLAHAEAKAREHGWKPE